MKRTLLTGMFASMLFSCSIQYIGTGTGDDKGYAKATVARGQQETTLSELDAFLETYSQQYENLYTRLVEAQAAALMNMEDGDTAKVSASLHAQEAFAAFTGNTENMVKASTYLQSTLHKSPLQVKQLKAILYAGANNPQIVSGAVKARIKAEHEQAVKVNRLYRLLNAGQPSKKGTTDNLATETDLQKRLTVWRNRNLIAQDLQHDLLGLRELRNTTVQGLGFGYEDYFDYQVAGYGMSQGDMMDLMRRIKEELRPLYRELHTYVRYTLAKKYGVAQVPDYLPAHWLPAGWPYDWSAMIQVSADLDSALQVRGPAGLDQEKSFFRSLGFPEIQQSSYGTPGSADPHFAGSPVFALPQHASLLTWQKPNLAWYKQAYHNAGHLYYSMAYTRPDVPVLLRRPANPAMQEAIGNLLEFALTQQPFLAQQALIDKDLATDRMQLLLREALCYVPMISLTAGVMSEWEQDFYTQGLPDEQLSQRWWELVKEHQGIVPPATEGAQPELDALLQLASGAAPSYSQALSYLMLFQLHEHIAKHILQQPPQATNYYGSQEAGTFLYEIMAAGATTDWKEMLEEKTGEAPNPRAMAAYFQPLLDYLRAQNKGRKYTLEAGVQQTNSTPYKP
ncbi:peptidyl-dipeptidase A [Pontibacter ummariensis]|uniref:Peptidyl-dipeptidase A n=1 Tax=Pontibacter ummariensis TaxID=1610492 RepID=A0A239L797_9BACT|nr:M2 family metallopeptidase [Pontibacter ummariensis]PRY03986.1 peptidyl-dipeptidase A [Pontibacter ummariensis]SNT26496.1 peptidyl-dipeptidase A [Pontibacter ummariensis]